jgi:hypothetical protein
MKKKLLLLLIVKMMMLPALISQGQDTIRHLIISKWNGAPINQAFAQLTNVGDSAIDISKFTFSNVNGHTPAAGIVDGVPYWNNGPRYSLRLNGRLEPGESFLIMNVWDQLQADGLPFQLPDMLSMADVKVHARDLSTPHDVAIPEWEVWGFDSIDVHDFLLRHHSGIHASILYYRLDNGDSVAVDQARLAYDPTTNTLVLSPSSVAGVTDASELNYLVRKADIKQGNTNWDNSRGISAEDSEWIVLPKWQGRTPYTTLKNFGNHQVSVQSTSANVDLDNKTITVEWGTERGDSLLKVLDIGPGMGWQYVQNQISADSAFNTVREGDIFEAYACGNELQQVNFELKVAPPANDNAIVYPLRNYSYSTGYWFMGSRYYVTKNDPVIDTIGDVPYATRVDTLLAYLEKAPEASWEVIWVDGTERVDLKNGDKLLVTAENGNTTKEYFIDVQDYEPSDNANLSAITWPDMPFFLDGWSGDTIPLFTPLRTTYTLTIPYGTTSIPVLKPIPANLRANIETIRATSLSGSSSERTTTFVVTAEDDSTVVEYRVIFNMEKPDELVQKYQAHPFISGMVMNYVSWIGMLELAHAGNVPLDLSDYMIVRSVSLNPGEAIQNAIPAVPTDANFQHRYMSYIPGYKYSDDTTQWKQNPGKIFIDPDVDPIIEPGDVFTMASLCVGRYTWLEGNQQDLVPKINKRWDSGDHATLDEYGVNVRSTPSQLKRAARALFVFKIMNDSIFNGTKEIGDPNDFMLVDAFGDAVDDVFWDIAGKRIADNTNGRVSRKSQYYEGVTTLGEGAGTNADDSHWIVEFLAQEVSNAHDLPAHMASHSIDPVSVYISTISSLTYLVSDGYTGLQSVQGDIGGNTLEQFYLNISKADTGQHLTILSGIDGSVKELTDNVAGDDTLVVVSADGNNTTRYLLIDLPLDNNAVLAAAEGSGYTIDIDGETGVISGMEFGAPLKDVLENVIKPELATLNIIDGNDNLVPLKTRTVSSAEQVVEGNALIWVYEYEYVDTRVGDSFYFEVIAQNGINKIVYKLDPGTAEDDAYVISSIYHVDQDSLIISGIPYGTSVPLFFTNIEVVTGATAKVVDKIEFQRETGIMAYDDLLVVTSADQSKTVTYYLDFLTETNPDVFIPDDTTSVRDNYREERLLIYPNPTSDRVYIRGISENAVVRLTDLSGRVISVYKSTELHDGIPLTGQSAGIYMILVSEKNLPMRHAKIIKY